MCSMEGEDSKKRSRLCSYFKKFQNQNLFVTRSILSRIRKF